MSTPILQMTPEGTLNTSEQGKHNTKNEENNKSYWKTKQEN